MKSNHYWRTILGILFLLVGGLAFLQTSGLLWFSKFSWVGMGLGILGFGGLIFLVFLLSSPTRRWWCSIPGFSLLGLSAGGALEILLPKAISGLWPGVAVLSGIALGFWVVYMIRPQAWWAIIPAGALSSVAAMAAAGAAAADEFVVTSIFFLGLAATFGLLAVLPTHKPMVWPWVPAGSLLLLALFFYLSAPDKADWVSLLWPGFLIVLGFFFLYQAISQHPDQEKIDSNEDNRT
jgi:hypothetical protein